MLVVGDGETALAGVARGAPRAGASLDEAAPRLNGLGVALRMKAESPAGFMPVLIFVGARRGRARARRSPSPTTSSTRPYDAREVVARVRGALAHARHRRRAAAAARRERGAHATPTPTTGLRNRAFLGERIGEEFKRAVRYNEPLSLVLLADRRAARR